MRKFRLGHLNPQPESYVPTAIAPKNAADTSYVPTKIAADTMQPAVPITWNEGMKLLGGKYLLKQLLGKGGQAEVWLAWNSSWQRDVAIKRALTTLDADTTNAIVEEAKVWMNLPCHLDSDIQDPGCILLFVVVNVQLTGFDHFVQVAFVCWLQEKRG